MYCDVVAALHEEWPGQDDAQEDSDAAWSAPPRVMGARYGLGGKDFTPAMAKGVFEELASAKVIPRDRAQAAAVVARALWARRTPPSWFCADGPTLICVSSRLTLFLPWGRQAGSAMVELTGWDALLRQCEVAWPGQMAVPALARILHGVYAELGRL